MPINRASKNSMSCLLPAICVVLVSCTTFVWRLSCCSAQPPLGNIVNASTPNPVGSGARAMGMGGAFIAVADDATAASWNPAGLTQLKKPEISFALSYFSRKDDITFGEHPEASGPETGLSKDINYLSMAYPFELLDRNMIVSLNYQLLYDFDRNIRTNITTGFSNLNEQKVKFRQRGKLRTLSPAYAIEITPDFSLGFTFNIWTDNLFWSNGWESNTIINASTYRKGLFNSRELSALTKEKDYDRFYGFSGFNMHIGFLWDINQFITIGGVVKTPFTGEMQHERVSITKNRGPQLPLSWYKIRIDEDVDMEMPLSYGLGVAVRFSDRFTTSLDVFRTEWDRFKMEDGFGRRWNPTTGKRSYESSTDETHQVRLGAEYLFIFPRTVVPVRGGLFYDPEPTENNPDDFWGATLGTGISLGDLIFDCAYQFRYGNNVGGGLFKGYSSRSDVIQHLLMVSFIYHF